jgi:hypothetical protein
MNFDSIDEILSTIDIGKNGIEKLSSIRRVIDEIKQSNFLV